MANAHDSPATGRPIRLLMVNTVKSGFNGQMMFILKYLGAMDRSDMDIGFVSRAEPIPEIRERLTALGVKIYPLPLRSKHPLSYMTRLIRVIRQGGYEIVHVHGNSATMAVEMMAARLAGARIRIAHSHNTSTGFPLVHKLLKPLLMALTTTRMACGEAAGRWLFGDRSFEVIPIASDPKVYGFDGGRRAAVRASMGVWDDVFWVGLIGQLIAVKNPRFLLEAFAAARQRRPELRLVMIGPGPMHGELEQAITGKGLEGAVTLTGPVQDVPDRMQALDLLAMPSLYEGFPNVLVEAQLAGLPALVSDRVTRDCDMTGLLTYLPLEVDAWADALVTARKTDRADACARACAAITDRGYNLNTAAAALKARYAELVAR